MHKPRLKLLVGSWHLLKQIMGFGNPTAGGFTTMAEALWAVGKLSKELKSRFDIELAVSAHWWHELIVQSDDRDFGYSAKWNNPRAIDIDQWAEGVLCGHYPRIGRIIPPGFGLPGSDDGAFINPDPERKKLARDMMVHSFLTSDRVVSEGVGEGNVIYWTGPDGIRWNRVVGGDNVLLGHDLNPNLQEWKLIVSGLCSALEESKKRGLLENSKLLIEGKPAGDPCYLDVFTDTTLEIEVINRINGYFGTKLAWWQGELCHSRGSGQTFHSAMNQAIDADVFDGQIHLNSGGLGAVNFTKMLSMPGGTPIGAFPQYVDPDYLPGEGLPEWVEDQILTIRRGALWSAQTGLPFEVEFDARFCRYADTVGKLQWSAEWVIALFNEEVKRLEKSK